jgi:glyoxylase-like metal-dependent hydrolase (beta-lactamase superfamily II)
MAWRSTPIWAGGGSTRHRANAPSHVVLHQPERGLLLSGDHLLGRVSLYYDFGYSPDPAGEFLASLDRVDALDVQLILAGRLRHRPRDAR